MIIKHLLDTEEEQEDTQGEQEDTQDAEDADEPATHAADSSAATGRPSTPVRQFRICR